MSASRRLLPTLAVLLTAVALASEAHAARPREIAPDPQTGATSPAKPALAAPRAASDAASPKSGPRSDADKPDKSRSTSADKPTRSDPPRADKKSSASKSSPDKPAADKPTSAADKPVARPTSATDKPADKSTPTADKPALDKPAADKSPSFKPASKTTAAERHARARSRSANHRSPGSPVLEASLKPEPRSGAKPLRPRHEPLLARHPAATCALDPLEAVGLRQHGRARDSLREFYWSDMARFFESSLDEAEPMPTQVADPAFLATDVVLRDLPAAVRGPLAAVAAARVIDRLGEREFNKVSKLLASLGPAQVASLLRADAPTLRGYVWTWLATTKTGGCHLGHLDLDFIEAAVGDRSVAVEHGDDLVYRSLGDYALAARARLATLEPQRFDAFLLRLTGAGEIDPLVRATAHGMLLRRAHWDTLGTGLRDPSPPVRAATALGALEMNHDKVEPAIVEHAASDPADLVTELIVGALLGTPDSQTRSRAQTRGPLAGTRDDRLAAAVTRWSGRGDPLEPLPNPQRPLRFGPGPVLPDMAKAPAQAEPAKPSPAVAQPTPVPTDSPAEPVPADSEPDAPTPASERRGERPEPRLPGVLDEPGEPLPPRAHRSRSR